MLKRLELCEQAFDEDDVRILTTAFDAAWQAVHDSRAAMVNGEAEATRELLALRIIRTVQFGVRDTNRLREDALLYLAQSNRNSSGC
jgi:hypothetical protein